jgi:endoribonuclease Dicer
MESGHDHHVLALRQSATVSGSLTTWASQLRSKVRVPSPPAALHEGPQPSLDPSSLDMCIEDPVTGGRINPAQAVRVILWLASTLGQRQPDVSDTTLLSYRTSGTQYLCTVQLPSILLSPVTSQPCLNLTQARRDACFHACTQLHQQGLLGTRLFQPPPEIYLVPHTPLPAHASKYSRKAPLFWDRCLKTSGLVLFPTLLYFDKEGNQHPSCRFGTDASRLLILTRQPLPSLQRFCTYQWGPRSHRLDAYRAGLIRGASFDVTPEQMDALYHFTLRSWRMVSNKRLVCALDQMPYLIAPLTSDIQATSSTTPTSPLPTFHESILWKEIEAAATVATMPFTLADLDKDVTDFIVQDRSAELTKRYLVKKIRRDLSPLSKPDAYSVCRCVLFLHLI